MQGSPRKSVVGRQLEPLVKGLPGTIPQPSRGWAKRDKVGHFHCGGTESQKAPFKMYSKRTSKKIWREVHQLLFSQKFSQGWHSQGISCPLLHISVTMEHFV